MEMELAEEALEADAMEENDGDVESDAELAEQIQELSMVDDADEG